MLDVTTSATRRDSYHHGDLRNALIEAATGLAEEGGPEAVTIRAAARSVGVTPTATYRHFASHVELLDAVKQCAFEGMSQAMAEYLAQVPAEGDPVDIAVQRFEASGRGYVRYALAEPGLFRTGFRTPPATLEGAFAGVAPYELLSQSLDQLVAVGYLDPEYRPGAEAAAWSAVHGLSLLLIDGPFGMLPEVEQAAIIDRTVAMVSRGLAGGPASRSPRPSS